MGIFGKPNIKKLKKRGDVDGLIKALVHEDRKVRRDAASAIGKIADKKTVPLLKKAVEPLIKALKDENAEVRYNAAHALGLIFSGAAWDPDEGAWAFDEIRTKEVVESLVEAFFKDEDENVRGAAALSVSNIPIPVTLEKGERMVRRFKEVGGVTAWSGFLLLTNQRLLYHGRNMKLFSIELPLAEIINCEVKSSLFGKKKLLVTARRAIFKSWSELVIQEVATRGLSQPPASVIEPKPLEFTALKSPKC